MAKPQDRAWDACAIIGWVGEQPDLQSECEPVIREAENGNVRLVVSALALAEVIKLKHGKQPVPKEARQRIEEFFMRTYIITRNVDPATAALSRELVWDHGIDPKDAIHVATALRAKVSVLDTFDDALLSLGKLIVPDFAELEIGKPNIPNFANTLFDAQ